MTTGTVLNVTEKVTLRTVPVVIVPVVIRPLSFDQVFRTVSGLRL